MSTETPLRALVAEEIRALLGRRNISASELARRVELTQRYISRRLTGETAFDVDDLEKIAHALNVEVADLMPRSNEGRTVVFAGDGRRQTTVAYSPGADQPHRSGHLSRTHQMPGTRRPVRLSHVKS